MREIVTPNDVQMWKVRHRELRELLYVWAIPSSTFPYNADNNVVSNEAQLKADLARYFELEELIKRHDKPTTESATKADKNTYGLPDLINYVIGVVRDADNQHDIGEITNEIHADRTERAIDMLDHFMRYDKSKDSRSNESHREFVTFVIRKMAETNTKAQQQQTMY